MNRLALLLAVAQGAGSVTRLAEQGRWTRQGAVLTATEAWENGGVLEPGVLDAGGDNRKMWYRGGGLHGPDEMLGYATSTDKGRTWTKSGSNPLLGSGVNGEAGGLICPHPRLFGGMYWIFYSAPDTGKWKLARSSDGLPPYTVTDSGLALPTNCIYFGNTTAWIEGSTYWAFVEAFDNVASLWKVWLVSSSTGTSGWSYANSGNPISSLSPGGLYAAPDIHEYNGKYQGWLHGATSGNLPTDIYRAYTDTSDKINWTLITPNPVLTHLGSAYEVDQVADPCLIEASGEVEMFYDADDNTGEVAAIKLATFPGSLGNLISGT